MNRAAAILVVLAVAGCSSSASRASGTTTSTVPAAPGERVAAADRVAIVTRAQGVTTVIPAGRVVVSDPTAFRRLRDAFDGLKIAPPDAVVHCPAVTEKSYAYTVAFAGSEEASPDIVATMGNCRSVAVLAAGKTAPALEDNTGAFLTAVARLFP